MELDRQSIEKRDFPIGRRGYDPAAVDAHLRTIAAEVEELRYALESRAGETLGSSAGTQVQGILEAAEATAAEIEQRAAEDARAHARAGRGRRRAHARRRDRARPGARRRGRARHRRARSSASSRWTRSPPRSSTALRDGASRLATRPRRGRDEHGRALRRRRGARGRQRGVAVDSPPAEPPAPAADAGADAPVRQGHSEFAPGARSAAPAARLRLPPCPRPRVPRRPVRRAARRASRRPPRSERQRGGNGDLDGARLIALNMALNGDSRAATDRYLAEHYELADRQKLLDEVFAAVEG